MGKKDKQKKKGAQKTAEKTEKKASQKLKKDLKAKGEESIEELIAHFQEEDRKQQQVIESIESSPSKRSSFTLTSHPEKEELILFGGEYFNGSKTFMYNDLFFYNIKKNQWLLIKSPNSPPPRSAHQAVALAHSGGQLWIFGGEFASPTQSQFYHYKDLWVFHFKEKKWEKINASGGPSSRSGHRMAVYKKQLFVFGGYHDNLRDYKYFNELYKFDLETYKWSSIDVRGTIPVPRSGCQMAAFSDGRLLVYGGYSKERQKKDIDKGVTHTDMFILQQDKNDETQKKWKSIQVRQSLCKPSPRCGFALIVSATDFAILFGGVQDKEESEEELTGICLNDMFLLDMSRGVWKEIRVNERETSKTKKDVKVTEKNEEVDEQLSAGVNDLNEVSDSLSNTRLSDREELPSAQETAENVKLIQTDDIFTVTIGPQTSCASELSVANIGSTADNNSSVFIPPARMNAGLAVNRGNLYLYGGLVEDGDRQLTLSDMYSLDLKKMDKWKVIIPLQESDQEWYDSSSEDEAPEELLQNEEKIPGEDSDDNATDTETE